MRMNAPREVTRLCPVVATAVGHRCRLVVAPLASLSRHSLRPRRARFVVGTLADVAWLTIVDDSRTYRWWVHRCRRCGPVWRGAARSLGLRCRWLRRSLLRTGRAADRWAAVGR